jgi:N-acyl-D-amino-acid deacylase
MYDIIIKNGTIVDGTGAPAKKKDISIIGDRISDTGHIEGKVSRVIDAEALVIAPGFIDIHSHTDVGLLVNSLAESKIRQGITTEIGGNCGDSVAPLGGKQFGRLLEWGKENNIEVKWKTVNEFLNTLEENGIAVNYGTFVGHGTIRSNVIGMDNRTPSRSELLKMKNELSQSMLDGAFGLSTGLSYSPGCFAPKEEILELCKILKKYNGIYATHMRSEGKRLLSSIDEALNIGKKTGIAIQISHLKATRKEYWWKMDRALRKIENGRRDGIDILFDCYPYAASNTSLLSFFPKWVNTGGRERSLSLLKKDENRKRVKNELRINWENMLLSSINSEKYQNFEGKTILEGANELKQSPLNFACDLLINTKGRVGVTHFCMSQENVDKVVTHPLSMVATDSSLKAPYGKLSKGKPHPRSYGTFPRVIRDYVRERELLSLAYAVRKMTGIPALRLGLSDRGVIKKGAFADIVIFNLEKIEDRATYANPHQYPSGIEYVMVNGQIVIEKGKHTGALPGKVLRKCSEKSHKPQSSYKEIHR